MNKRGQGLNVTTIIIVVLAILVLVILTLYFTGGMQKLWEQITGVAGTYNEADVTTARQLCITFCTTQDEQSFCSYKFNLRKGDAVEVKYCDQYPINAHLSPECTAFRDIDCEDKGYREEV